MLRNFAFQAALASTLLFSNQYILNKGYKRTCQKYLKYFCKAILCLCTVVIYTSHSEELGEIHVTEEGMHEIKVIDLFRNGINLIGEDAANIAIVDGNRKIYRMIEQTRNINNVETIRSYSTIKFLGSPNDEIYSGKTRIYKIVRGRVNVKKIKELKIHRVGNSNESERTYYKTVVLEGDNLHESRTYGTTPWIYTIVTRYHNYKTNTVHKNFELKTPELKSSVYVVNIDYVGMSSYKDVKNDHKIEFYINKNYIGSDTFDGRSKRRFKKIVRSKYFKDGENEISFRIVKQDGMYVRYDEIAIEKVSIRYESKLDIRNKDQIQIRGRGNKFTVTTNSRDSLDVYYKKTINGSIYKKTGMLKENNNTEQTFYGVNNQSRYYYVVKNGKYIKPTYKKINSENIIEDSSEYVVIAHPEFMNNYRLKQLIKKRESEGLSARIVNVESIYKKYSDGYMNPEAIQAFIKKSYSQGLKYVVLVGAFDVDVDNKLSNEKKHIIPGIYMTDDIEDRLSTWEKEKGRLHKNWSMNDFYYSMVDNDYIPDVAVGRFPVNTNEELNNMVYKIINYKSIENEKTKLLSMTGRGIGSAYMYNSLQYLSEISNDNWDSEGLYNQKKTDNEVNRNVNTYINDFNNSESDIYMYFGHGYSKRWSTFLDIDDVSRFTNTKNYPLLFTFACQTNMAKNSLTKKYDINASNEVIAQKMTVHKSGPSAYLGHTELVFAGGVYNFMTERNGFLMNLNERGRIGDIIKESVTSFIQKYNITKKSDFHIKHLQFFGDPAQQL